MSYVTQATTPPTATRVEHQPAPPANTRCVSVVIPSRDGRETLPRALRSLVPNAPYIREVLIVYSNSPDDYRNWCEVERTRYADFFSIRMLDSGAHSNGSIARNCGMLAASSEYVALLDDDDEWLPNKLDVYLRTIRERRLSGDFVLFSTAIECNDDRSEADLYPAQPYRSQPIADFILKMHGGAQTSALLLPRTLAQRVLFDATLQRHQDYDFCMRLEEAGARFFVIDRPLSYWYRRGNSIAKGNTFDFCAQWINANRHRISRAAYIGYLEKELLSSARNSRRAGDYWRFLSRNLTVAERAVSAARVGMRVVRHVIRHKLLRLRRRSSDQLLKTHHA